MEDLIACLYPTGISKTYSRWVVRSLEESKDTKKWKWFVQALKQRPELPGRTSRESTLPPDHDCDEDNKKRLEFPKWHYEDGIQLKFSHGLKNGQGFVFGRARNCDITLPPLSGIGREYCCITFDEKQRLVVRDMSTYGTTITYNDQGRTRRNNFTWIIGGDQVVDRKDEIIIEFHEELKFQIIVSKPTFPLLFSQNVVRFRAEIEQIALIPLGRLGLLSEKTTAAASGTETPSDESILLVKRQLGKGTSAAVQLVWDVSTGKQYASKLLDEHSGAEWREEISLMKDISHDHIIQYIRHFEPPMPRLILEYAPFGNLREQHQQKLISDTEALQLLRQILSALVYLHALKITHRDISPANILVCSRVPFYVKLADFGLSKRGDHMKTVCGTDTYAAPEIASRREKAKRSKRPFVYTQAVDIWSLGVVVFEHAYGLPAPGGGRGLEWCNAVVRALDDEDSDQLTNVLSTMVVLNPKKRRPALECLAKASRIPDLNRSATPIQAPHSHEQQQIKHRALKRQRSKLSSTSSLGRKKQMLAREWSVDSELRAWFAEFQKSYKGSLPATVVDPNESFQHSARNSQDGSGEEAQHGEGDIIAVRATIADNMPKVDNNGD